MTSGKSSVVPQSNTQLAVIQQVPENYTPPAPITAPIMAPLGADPQAQPLPSGVSQAMAQGPHGAQVPFSAMQQCFSPPAMNPAMPKTSMEGPPGAPTGDVIQVFSLQLHNISHPSVENFISFFCCCSLYNNEFVRMRPGYLAVVH